MPIRRLLPALLLLSAYLVDVSAHAASAAGRGRAGGQPGQESIVEACRDGLDRKVADDGDDRGYAGRGAAVDLDADGQGSELNKNTVKLSGTGRLKYGADYLWAPMSFSCEWDLAKQKLKKVSYKLAKGADPTALPAEKAKAVSACRGAARRDIEQEARRRRYYSSSITMEDGSRFDESREIEVRIEGRGSYKLDPVQQEATAFTFSCAWEEDRGRIADVRLDRRTSWQGEMGQITCESQKMQRRTCTAPIGGRVRLVSNYSDAPCSQGASWSHDSYGITVWDGCRARFEFEMR
jgi:hypothetical protein